MSKKKKKKKTQARNVSPSRPSSKRVCYVCVCVCVCVGVGGGGNPNVPEAGITTWAIFQCFSLCRGGKKENAGQGIGCVGKCHVFFFFFLLFSATHTKNLATEDMVALCASLSLSLSLLSGLARALRGDAGRVRVRARVCTSSGLPFPSREGGEDLRTTRFLLDFPR